MTAPEEKSENPNEGVNEQDIPAMAAKKLQEAQEANEFADRQSPTQDDQAPEMTETIREQAEDPGTPEAKDEGNVVTIKAERRKSAAGM